MSALMQTYARLPVTFSHGEGVYLFDTDGRRYLDALSGISVTNLGHAHPAITAAVSAAKLAQTLKEARFLASLSDKVEGI